MRPVLALALLMAEVLVPCLSLHSPPPRPGRSRKLRLHLSEDKDLAGIRGLKGYYRRPSRAIEKGGGFFVPGLEDEKIRIFSATMLLVGLLPCRPSHELLTGGLCSEPGGGADGACSAGGQ